MLLVNIWVMNRFTIMKKSIYALATILFTMGVAVSSAAWTAAELNRSGLEHFRLAFYEMTPQQNTAGALREYQLAEHDFLAAIRLAPDLIEPNLHMGRTCFVQKKYQTAAGFYQQALKIAPERHDVSLQLASALQMAENYQQAIVVLTELQLKERNEKSLRILADFIQRLELQKKQVHPE